MHDTDRTMLEFEQELDALETDGYELEFEEEADFVGEYDQETVFDEVEEMELAAQLLEIQDEAELDHFLGGLIRKAAKVIRSPVGKALGGVLRKAARAALPVIGAAAGNFFAPGVGGAVGGRIASHAGRLFGLELEGMSPQDQEFEVARRFVRLAGSAARNAAQMPASTVPQAAATAAMLAAARAHAPGLIPRSRNGARSRVAGRSGAASGTWYRRGRTIVLTGI